MKLSKVQQHVIGCMKDGWELGVMTDANGGCWLQQGGLGHGGKSETVSSATLYALLRMELVAFDEYHFPTRKVNLTNAGKETAC